MGEDAVLMGGDFDGCGVCGVGRFLFPEAQVLEAEILGRYPYGRVPGVEKGDDSIFLPAAFEGEEAEPLLKGQCAIVSASEGGVRVPALDPKRGQFLILSTPHPASSGDTRDGSDNRACPSPDIRRSTPLSSSSPPASAQPKPPSLNPPWAEF